MLDGNAWLTARIFGALQKARKDLLQVTRYLTEDDLRAAAQARVAALLDEDTQLVIGHSLGSVLAWEACQALDRPLPVLVTLGSPLGLDTVVYPRLRPQPPAWPPPVHRWVNVAHPDDIVAGHGRVNTAVSLTMAASSQTTGGYPARNLPVRLNSRRTG
jgi:pimeloyl-ACP methyl ester carboxylesterase